jgi:phosphatidylserine decarboxylase
LQDLNKITYIERYTKLIHTEKVYGNFWIKLLYGQHWLQKLISFCILPFIVKKTFFSQLYGRMQRLSFTKKKIKPFINKYQLDPEEFEKTPSEFTDFNDFFTRKLKASYRPIFKNNTHATLPADGKYLCFPNVENISDLTIKKEKLNLNTLLIGTGLDDEFKDSSLVVARLCPSDYHRFHFPIDAQLKSVQLLNGPLYSVNPIAWKQNLTIFNQNKRYLCVLESPQIGQLLVVCVGATNVGTISITAKVNHFYNKGDELGFFSFGGSSILLLFKKNTISFDKDFIENTKQKIETSALFGDSLGNLIKDK